MLTGGCLCGAVRYEARGTPFHEAICHCTSCRRAAGAASVAWFSALRRDFVLTAGAPARFASSPGVVRGFCGRCGTPLTYDSDASPEETGITICSLDDPGAVVPAEHIHIGDKPAWSAICDGRPAHRADPSVTKTS